MVLRELTLRKHYLFKPFDAIHRFILRFRYPVSMPEDLEEVLGLEVPNFWHFDKVLAYLRASINRPNNLRRYMPRDVAERLFSNAVRKERFKQRSLYSYYFRGTWMEFALHFDDQSRLRRVYLHHRDIDARNGVELLLREA